MPHIRLMINGAGKSTTINMLCTLYAATAGSVEVCGYQVGKQDEEVRKRIGVVYIFHSLCRHHTKKRQPPQSQCGKLSF